MLIDNGANVDRKKSNKPNRFCDDVSPWDSENGTISKVFYLLTDNFKLIYKKNSEYCISKGKKKTFVPIEPQPDVKDVVIMNRYYCTLKCQNTYKKRVTWFSSASDENLSNVAVVEYIGGCSGISGNSPWTFAKKQRAIQKNKPRRYGTCC